MLVPAKNYAILVFVLVSIDAAVILPNDDLNLETSFNLRNLLRDLTADRPNILKGKEEFLG